MCAVLYRYCTGKKTPGGAGTHTGHTGTHGSHRRTSQPSKPINPRPSVAAHTPWPSVAGSRHKGRRVASRHWHSPCHGRCRRGTYRRGPCRRCPRVTVGESRAAGILVKTSGFPRAYQGAGSSLQPLGLSQQSFHYDTRGHRGPAYTQMQIQHRSRAPGPPYTSDQPYFSQHRDSADLCT